MQGQNWSRLKTAGADNEADLPSPYLLGIIVGYTMKNYVKDDIRLAAGEHEVVRDCSTHSTVEVRHLRGKVVSGHNAGRTCNESWSLLSPLDLEERTNLV